MRSRARVAMFALIGALTACTALLDLQTARFDDVDGGSNGGGDGASSDGAANDGTTEGGTIIVEPDAGNTTLCSVTFGEGDGKIPAGLTTCPGVGMVDLTTNASHCGECGRACGGSAPGCSDGQCNAEAISLEPENTTVIGATSTHVAWAVIPAAQDSTVLKVAKLDGSDALTLDSVDSGPWRYGALTSDVLFVSRQTVDSTVYPIDGATPFTVGGNNFSDDMVLRGNELFLETYNANLRRVTLVPDASASDIYVPADGASSVAVAGKYLYWVKGQANPPGGIYPQIGRIDVDTKVIAFSQWRGNTSTLAVDGAYAYVFDASKQDVVRVPLDLSGPGERLSHWTGTPWDNATTMLTDGEYVYLRVNLGGGEGAVLRVPRCGGKPFVVKQINTIGRVAIGGGHVYWGDFLGPKGLKRVPK